MVADIGTGSSKDGSPMPGSEKSEKKRGVRGRGTEFCRVARCGGAVVVCRLHVAINAHCFQTQFLFFLFSSSAALAAL
jgi:hypothetical protein